MDSAILHYFFLTNLLSTGYYEFHTQQKRLDYLDGLHVDLCTSTDENIQTLLDGFMNQIFKHRHCFAISPSS